MGFNSGFKGLNPQKICKHVQGLPVCLISLPTFAASAAVLITPKAKEIFGMAGKVFYTVQKYYSNQISHVFKNYPHMTSAPHSLSSNKFGAVNQAALIFPPLQKFANPHCSFEWWYEIRSTVLGYLSIASRSREVS